MKKILVLNGPNLNLLGVREPERYGTASYADLKKTIRLCARELGAHVRIYQTNSEGKLVSLIQRATSRYDGIVLNPAAYTHTSVALLDALLATRIPTVEVHLTDPDAREDFRKISFVRSACIATVKGKGFDGYREALSVLLSFLGEK